MSRPLQGTTGAAKVRTRKRNIVVQRDPESFLLALEDHFAYDYLETIFEALDSDQELDYRTYYEFFFDRFISGSIGLCLGRVDPNKEPLLTSMLGCHHDDLADWIAAFERFLRKRPFLKTKIGETFGRIILSIDTAQKHQDRIIEVSMTLTKEGLLKPETGVEYFLLKLLRIKHLVTSGQAIDIVARFINELAAATSRDTAWALMANADVIAKLEEFVPVSVAGDYLNYLRDKKSLSWLVDMFRREELSGILATHEAHITDVMRKVDSDDVDETMTDAQKMSIVAGAIAEARDECKLDAGALMLLTWRCITSLMRNQGSKEIAAMFARWCGLLTPVVKDDIKLQAALMSTLQTTCYNNPHLIDSFKTILMQLYNGDCIEGDVIVMWFKRGGGPGRTLFCEQIADFVEWLEASDDEEA